MPLTTEQKRAALQQLQNDPSPEAQRVSERLQADIAEFDSQMASASSSDAKFTAPVAPAPASPAASGGDKPWWFFGPTGQAPDAANDPYRRMAPSGLERIGTPDDTSNLVIGGEEAFKRMADYAGAGAQAGLEHGIEGAKDVVRGIARPDDEGGVDWGRIGRGALQTGAGAASAAIQAVPTVGAMSGSGAMLRQAIADEEAQGYPVPLGVRLADLPTAGFEKFDEVVGGNVAKWTGSEDAGTLATLLGMGALFGGGKMAEGALRARLPSNIPGSTRPGLVGVRDAGPLVEPPTGLARRAPGGPPAAIPPTVPPPARLPFAPRGLPEPNGLRPQPDVPPPIPKDAVISPENRQLPTWQDPAFTRRQDLVREGTLTPGEAGIERGPRQPIIPPNRSFIKPTEPPADLPRGPVPGEGRQTPAPFARPVLESQPSTVGETLPARAPRTETDLGTASESSTALGRPTKRRQRPWTEEDQAQAEIQRDKEIAEAAKIDYAKIPENRLRLMADGDLNPFKRTAAEVEWRNRQGRPTDDIGAEIWWQERIDALEDQAVTKYGHDANSVKVRDDLSVGTDLEKLDPVLHAKIAFAERMRDERAPPMMTPEQRLPAPESIVGEPMPPVPRAETVPDYLPPEAGGATGLETPGETKPLHRSLTGEDLTPEQRVSGLVDRLLAEDPTADMRIIKVRARDQLRAAGEPLLLDDVLAKEIESRQFDESINPRPKGKTGAEIAEEPPPSPSTTKPPFRSGKGMGRNSERGEAINPAEPAAKAYRAIDSAYDKLNRTLGKGIDKTFEKLLDPLADIEWTSGKGGKKTTLRKQFQPAIKRVGGEALDIERVRGGKEQWAYHEARKGFDAAAKALSDAPPEVVQAFGEWAGSERSGFPPELAEHRPILEGVTHFIQNITRERVKRGRLSQEAADQFERYLPSMWKEVARNAKSGRRSNVPRVMKNFMRESDSFGVILDAKALGDIDVKALAKEIDPNAVVTTEKGNIGVKFRKFTPSGDVNEGAQASYNTLMDRLKDAFGEDRAAANEQFREAVKGQSVEGAKKAAQQRQQARTIGQVVKHSWEPMPPEVQEMLGGQVHPAERIGVAIYKGMVDLINAEALEALSKAKDDNGQPYAFDKPREGLVQLPESDAYGPMKGKWVGEDLAEYLKNSTEGSPSHEGFMFDMLQGMKSNLTIMSPAAVGRQWLSAPQFFMLYGIKNPGHPAAARAFAKAVEAVYKSDSALAKRATQSGWIGGKTFPEVELEGGSGKGMFGPRQYGPGRLIMQPWLLSKKGRRATNFMENRYSEADNLARAFGGFYAEDHLGMSPREAREFVNKHSQNYGEVGPLVEKARFTWFMSPFAAFKAESPRIFANTLRERPLDAIFAASWRQIIKRGVQAAAVMGILSGVSDDEKDAAEVLRGVQQIPVGRDDKGRLVLLDTRYIDLWGDYVPRKSRLGDPASLLRFVAENVGADINPLVVGGLAVIDGKTQWGDRIWYESDDGMTRLFKSAAHVMQAYAPPLTPVGVDPASLNPTKPSQWKFRPAGWHAREIGSAVTGTPHQQGRDPPTMAMALLTGLIGLRMTPIDVARELDRIERQGSRAEGNLEDAFERGDLTAAELFEELLNLYADEAERYEAAIKISEPKKTRAPFAR